MDSFLYTDFEDYQISNGMTTVTIPSGSPSGAKACVDITLAFDLTLEGDQVFRVTLGNVSSPVITPIPGETIVTIQDSDSQGNFSNCVLYCTCTCAVKC